MIPKEISTELKEYICIGFKLIINSKDLNDKERSFLLSNLLSLGAGVAWSPKAITHEAIQFFVNNNFKKPKGLERAHWPYHRRDTIKYLIDTKWENDEWWDEFKERDYTILSTRKENRDESNFDKLKIVQIPIEKKLFWGKRVGFEYGQKEKDFIIEKAKELSFIK